MYKLLLATIPLIATLACSEGPQVRQSRVTQMVPERASPLVAKPIVKAVVVPVSPTIPRTKAACRPYGDYCVFDTRWKPTETNDVLEALTPSEADTDGAGCNAIDSRGRVVASLVPDGPVIFRYKGQVYDLAPSEPAQDGLYFTQYGRDDLAFGFKWDQVIAEGEEFHAYDAYAQLLINEQLHSVEVRLECGA